jgi:nucleoside-diphosphate-sugar epimerase
MTIENPITSNNLPESVLSSFQGRRVLVTGADGFIGSHLAENLLRLRAKVGIFVRGSARLGCGSWNFRCLEAAPDSFESIIAADIASADALSLIRDFDPEIVFHLAAIAYVNYSFDRPREVFLTNAVGTQNVLEAARLSRTIERVIIMSSSEVYGPCQSPAIAEDHPLNPTSPYAASKLAADRLAWSYRQTYGLPVIILRPFNTYGPRHTYDVIPKFIKLALRNEPLPICGDGLQERDFTYVSDTVKGLLLAASNPNAVGAVINLGSSRCVTIRNVAECIVRLAESRSPIVHVEPRMAEVTRLCANTGFARDLLGFRATVSLEDGLAATIAWERVRKTP